MKKITDFLFDFCQGMLALPGFVAGLICHSTVMGFQAARYALDERMNRRIAEIKDSE